MRGGERGGLHLTKEILELQKILVDRFKIKVRALPWWHCGYKNPPANAGDTGSIPDLGRSHIPLSLCTTAIEPLHLKPRSCNCWSPDALEPGLHDEKPPNETTSNHHKYYLQLKTKKHVEGGGQLRKTIKRKHFKRLNWYADLDNCLLHW